VQRPPKVIVPTLDEWFRGTPTPDGEYTGRYWIEWVVGRQNKQTERRSKRSVYEQHLRPAFGRMRLNEITVAEINRFRASLLETLSKKTINKILCVLSKPLRYAVDCDLITKAPKIGLYKIERPEVVARLVTKPSVGFRAVWQRNGRANPRVANDRRRLVLRRVCSET
jgi:hypothetical protein